MRVTFFLAVPMFALAVMAAEYYSDMYDKTNVETILKNERLFKPYIACLLDKGSCTADARAFKMTLPDAISTNCTRCSPRQKDMAITIVRHLKEFKPESYSLLLQKYDPDNRFMEQFNRFLDSARTGDKQ